MPYRKRLLKHSQEARHTVRQDASLDAAVELETVHGQPRHLCAGSNVADSLCALHEVVSRGRSLGNRIHGLPKARAMYTAMLGSTAGPYMRSLKRCTQRKVIAGAVWIVLSG